MRFSLGVLHGFSRKSNEDEFFPKIEWGMDFLGNQMGVAKKIKNNNMIRLVPTRIEIQI